jgi:hypothetical protein
MPRPPFKDSGVLFANDRKAKQTDPDFTGKGRFFGIPVWLSLWKKTSAKHPVPYFSITVRKRKPNDS